MEGTVTWAQLGFAAFLLITGFGAAGWVLLKLTEILVRLENLATKSDLDHTKRDIYQRMDTQWNSWMEAHGVLSERVKKLEIRMGPEHGA